MLISPCSAATYYASPNGNGDGKTVTTPASLADGLKQLQDPGDTLYLLNGQYDLGNTVLQNLRGSASRRIVIAGYDTANHQSPFTNYQSTILDFRQTPYGTRGLQIKNTCSFLHIKNLTLRYSGKNNLYNEGSYCLFENLDIYGSADTGCQMKNGGNNTIRNVDSHDNFDYETMSGSAANFGGNADGFADKQFTGAGNHYIGCRAWNNSDDGWDFFQRVSNSETVIENCVCFANGAPYYNMKNHPRYLTDKTWFDSKVGTQMTDRYGNTITVTLEKYPCQGNGNGFKMGGQFTDHKIIVHHCLAVGNYARGYDQNNNGGTMWLYNNSAYDNYVNYGFTTAYGTNTLRNNISLDSQNKDAYSSQNVAANDHNSWNNIGCSKTDFLSLDTTQILAPRNSDNSLPEGTFMRLVDGSPLVDAGIDVNLGYNGSAPDLGCYEKEGEHHYPDPEDTIPTVQPEGTHRVAFVTIIGSLEDKTLLAHLRKNDSLFIVETDATDASVDYSDFEVIVLGSKPNSSAAGYTPLKGYNKPMVLLKPFLLKANVWNWGTAANTSDLFIAVTTPEHPLFQGLPIIDNTLPLFTQCYTNAVTAISEWQQNVSIQPADILASPLSQPSYTTVADLPAGTDCNGVILPQRMVMIGVSEYSTAYLTDAAKRLIENAILYLLDIHMPEFPEQISMTTTQSEIRKYIHHGQLYIRVDAQVYDACGRPVHTDL